MNATNQAVDEAQDALAPAVNASPVAISDRIASLDFIRGIAVMGILFANIVSFGQPFNAYMFPGSWIGETADPDGWMWIAQFVLIDGKMRGLFTLLFGAGMYLFMERAWERGSSRWVQMWRLFLLMCFGFIHFIFIWMGDILAMYGIVGFFAVACMRWQAGTQMRVALAGYILGAVFLGGAMTMQFVIVETPFGDSEPLQPVRAEMVAGMETSMKDDAETARFKQEGDYGAMVEKRLTKQLVLPLISASFMFLETLPLMLMGMALYRFGFFSGEFDRAKMLRWGWIGLIGGGAITLALGLVAQANGFSFFSTSAAFIGWSVLPRLAMVLGLAALLVEYSRGAAGWFYERVSAAGRVAFTNYLGTSIVMLFVFHGWALGLFGEINRPQLYAVTVLTCALMLLWSKPWLDRFRYGPLEWLWRCLTYRQLFPIKR